MNVFRTSLLFQLTTNPQNLGVSRAHIAGWSESTWNDTFDTTLSIIRNLANKRAALLPAFATIVGYRQQTFNLQPNRIIPLGASTGALNIPGVASNLSDIPQMALSLVARGTNGVNTRRFMLRGVPDGVVKNGEFDPTDTYAQSLLNYQRVLVNDQWDFVCRDLTLPTFRVVAIALSTIVVSGPHGIAVGALVRLLRVRDKTGKSIKGVFRVTAVPDANSLTVDGLVGVIVGISGAVREDRFAIQPIANVATGRITTRRVGRPFESYRGRRSKRTA